MLNILVLCTGNSCRSQMAHGYLQQMGGHRINVLSAGIETHGVNPKAIQVMMEDGVDISHHTSNKIDEYAAHDFDYIITVCDNAKERCPYLTVKAKKFHHDFPDPAKAVGTDSEILNSFRNTRDQIKEYVANLLKVVRP